MEKKIQKAPILVTGCARSGAGMIAGALSICGAFGGALFGTPAINKKGVFENGQIQEFEKGYLRTIGLDPSGQNPIAVTNELSIPTNWKAQVENIMLSQGYSNGSWFYKSAKACQIWPIWDYAFPDAKWIIVRRRSVDIADSCLGTGYMNKYSTFEDWIKWIQLHEEKFVEMIQAGLNVKQIWPERMVWGNYEQLYEVVEWLGLPWKGQEIMDFIEPKLWKSKQKAGIKL